MKNFSSLRIGNGWDRHQLKKGLNLFLGGVQIPSKRGCVAHSDGDVLIHAIIDSLLGALCLGDIGTHFPPSDPQYKNIDSKLLLTKVYGLVKAEGYHIVNMDTFVVLEEPKLKPHIAAIRTSLANLMECDFNQISVKAKTSEHCDSVGKKKAIDASAVVLLEPLSNSEAEV